MQNLKSKVGKVPTTQPNRVVNLRTSKTMIMSTFIENLIKSLDAVGTVVKTTLSSPEQLHLLGSVLRSSNSFILSVLCSLPLLAALHCCRLSCPVVVRRPWLPEGALGVWVLPFLYRSQAQLAALPRVHRGCRRHHSGLVPQSFATSVRRLLIS